MNLAPDFAELGSSLFELSEIFFLFVIVVFGEQILDSIQLSFDGVDSRV